jgi:hypothetical protein
MTTKFASVSAALARLEKLAIGERIEVAGRSADVIACEGSKVFRYTHESVVADTSRPPDGRKFVNTYRAKAMLERE